MDELETLVAAEEAAGNPEGLEKPKKKKREKKEKVVKEKKPPRDNIARINGMETIGEVRKALQIAIAKKAKAAGKPETQARYDIEIDCAKTRLQELLDSAKTLTDLIKLGEEPNKIITHYIKDREVAFDKWLEDNGYKASKRVLKAVSDDIATCFYDDLPVELHDALVTRHTKKDYRLRAACKSCNMMAAAAAGDITFVDGRWRAADGTFIGVEAKDGDDTAEEDAAE